MKVKPKEVLLNLPIVLLFEEVDEISSFASNINTVVHGKVKLKVEELGTLGGRFVALFYMQRNNESQELHDEFIRLIEQEEIEARGFIPEPEIQGQPSETQVLRVHRLCDDCGQ